MRRILALAALVVLAWPGSARALEENVTSDKNMQSHYIRALPAPTVATNPMRLQDVAPGAGWLKSSALNGTITANATITGADITVGTLPVTALADVAGLSVLGRSVATTGAWAAITGTNNTVFGIQGSLAGFYPPLTSTLGVTAEWSVTGARVFCVDSAATDDSAAGFADSADTTLANVSAATVSCGAVAKKTWAGLMAIIPPVGQARTMYIVGAKASYSDRSDLLDRAKGYSTIAIRGTSTDTTCGATKFTGDAADLACSGATTATGAFAAGYNPSANVTSDTITLTLVGGGSPSFAAEPALPDYWRFRCDAATTTVALRNKVFSVVERTAADAIRLDQSATWATTDVCYLEEPGLVFSSTTASSWSGNTTAGFLLFNGVKFSGSLSFNGGLPALAFVHATTLTYRNPLVMSMSAVSGAFGAPANTFIGPTRVTTLNATGGAISIGSQLGFANSGNAVLGVSGNSTFTSVGSLSVGTRVLFGGNVTITGGAGGLGSAFDSAAYFGGVGNAGQTADRNAAVRVLGAMSLIGARQTFGVVDFPSTSQAFGMSWFGAVDLTFRYALFGGTKTDAGVDASKLAGGRITYIGANADSNSCPHLTGTNGDVYGGINTVWSGPTASKLYYPWTFNNRVGTAMLPNGSTWMATIINPTPGSIEEYSQQRGMAVPTIIVWNSGAGTIPEKGIVHSTSPGDSFSWALADATTTANAIGSIGIALHSIAEDKSGLIAIAGGNIPIYWSDTPGGSPGIGGVPVYLSEVPGQVRKSPPGGSNVTRFLGWSVGEDEVALVPDNHILGGGLELTGIVYGDPDFAGTTLERSALTGAITAPVGSNTTAFRTFSALSVLGNSVNTTAIPSEIGTTAGSGHALREFGSGLSFGTLGPLAVPALDAHFWTDRAESTLANEVNLGALTTGLLKITVSGSVATPSTAVAGSDFQAVGNYITQLTGEVTAIGPGSVAATITNNAVTDAKLRNSNAVSVIGRASSVAGAPADIIATTDGDVLRMAVGGLGWGAIPVASVTGAVTTSRTLTAGAGMTGGGDFSADRTFNVVANADATIVVNADDIQVGTLITGNFPNVVSAGSCTYCSATFDAKGRATAFSSGTAPVTSVSGTATRISSTGGTTPALDLVTTAVTPGSYTSTNLTVDAYGRITAASNGSAAGLADPGNNGALYRTALNTTSALNGTTGSVMFFSATGVIGQDNANYFWDDTNNTLGLGTNTIVAGQKLSVLGTNTLASSAGLAWDAVYIDPGTLTVTGTTTTTELAGIRIKAPTITDSSAHTTTNAATLIVEGPPVAAGSETIANANTAWFKAGRVRFPVGDHTTASIHGGAGSGFFFESSTYPAMLGPGGVAFWHGDGMSLNTTVGNPYATIYFGSGTENVGRPDSGDWAGMMHLESGSGVVLGPNSALSTSATTGFAYPIRTMAGTPTGAATAIAGHVAMAIDTTNDRLYERNSSWKIVGQYDGGLSGAPGILKTDTSGIHAIATANTDYQAAIAWPTSGYVVLGTGATGGNPTSDAHLQYDTANDHLIHASGGSESWYNLDGATNYERVRATWGITSNTFVLKSEAGGTGTVRAMKLDADTASLVIQASGASGYVALGQSFGVNPDIVGDADRITLRGTQSIASASSVALDAVKFDMSSITVTGTTHVTDAGGVNAVSFPGPTYTGTGGAKTIDYAATIRIGDAPDDSGDLTIANKYALWIDAGAVRFEAGRLDTLVSKSSAANVSLKPSESNLVHLTGATTVHTLWTGNDTNVDAWTPGSVVTIVCTTTGFTLKHNGTGASDYVQFDLSGDVDYAMTAGATLTVYYTGGSWKETARSAP